VFYAFSLYSYHCCYVTIFYFSSDMSHILSHSERLYHFASYVRHQSIHHKDPPSPFQCTLQQTRLLSIRYRAVIHNYHSTIAPSNLWFIDIFNTSHILNGIVYTNTKSDSYSHAPLCMYKNAAYIPHHIIHISTSTIHHGVCYWFIVNRFEGRHHLWWGFHIYSFQQ
jgi:hypothetical protein